MKALSIKQPWASLIIAGIKPVENRTWKSNYRGQLLIHAGKRFDEEGTKWLVDNRNYPHVTDCIEESRALTGGIIGSVFMADCVMDYPSPWFFGPFGFVFDCPVPFPFLQCPGKLSFFDIDYAALSFDELTRCQ